MKRHTPHTIPPIAGNACDSHAHELSHTATVRYGWDGKKLPENRETNLQLVLQADYLALQWRAPNLHNPSPSEAPGAFWKLWEHDVVELFFASANEQYLEVEFGPYGHYLVLQMSGARSPVAKLLPMQFSLTGKDDSWWSGQAKIPLSFLPRPVLTWNAYAIYTEHGKRHYCALAPGEGPPDFHQLSCFQPIPFPIK